MFQKDDCLVKNPHLQINFENWQKTVDLMAEIYSSSCAAIVQLRDNVFNTVSTSSNPDNFLEINSNWPWEMQSFCRRMMETKHKLYVSDALNSEEWSCAPPVSQGPVRSYLGFPLFWPDGSLFGSICLIDTKATDYADTFIELLRYFKRIIESDLQHVFDYEEIQKLLAEKARQQKALEKLALFDPLTGCANRTLLWDKVSTNISKAVRQNERFSLIYMDLDNFKPINDRFGHSTGDQILSMTARKIRDLIRNEDTLARIGGDEFIILFDDLIKPEKVLPKIIAEIEKPLQIASEQVFISASFGCSHYPEDGSDADTLIDTADRKMYQWKTNSEEKPS